MIGTIFILGEPMKGESDRAYYVLVTANHILDKMKGDEAIIFLREKIDDSYRKIAYPITIRKKGEPLWVRHPEVDIAAMYINLPNDIDFPSLSISTLADDKIFEKYEIRPGDELLCLGFPFGREANPAGFPILRSGRIASYPIIPSKETKYFLFDFEVFKGNSGGPVYCVLSGERFFNGTLNLGIYLQYIVGLISEEYIETEEIKTLYEEQKITYPLALAKVIHASFIKETIELLPIIE
jgi:hypothetical protein